MGRVLLLLVSLKLPSVCKCYLVYGLSMSLIDYSLVQTDALAQNMILQFMIVANFVCFHYSFLKSYLAALVCQISASVVRFYIYEEDEAGQLKQFFVNMAVMTASLAIYSLLASQAIRRFARNSADLAVLQQKETNNKALANEFGEALIVCDLHSYELLYQNKALEKLKLVLSNEGTTEQEKMKQLRSAKIFALFPEAILSSSVPDLRKTVRAIDRLKEYVSIDHIVSQFARRH